MRNGKVLEQLVARTRFGSMKRSMLLPTIVPPPTSVQWGALAVKIAHGSSIKIGLLSVSGPTRAGHDSLYRTPNPSLSQSILLCDTQHPAKVQAQSHPYWNRSTSSTCSWLLPMVRCSGARPSCLAAIVVSSSPMRGISSCGA